MLLLGPVDAVPVHIQQGNLQRFFQSLKKINLNNKWDSRTLLLRRRLRFLLEWGKYFFFFTNERKFCIFLSIYFRVQSSLKHFKFQNKVFVFKDICWDFIEFQFSIFWVRSESHPKTVQPWFLAANSDSHKFFLWKKLPGVNPITDG